MRKSTKIALLVAALVALCSFAAFATGWTWDEAAQEWTYLDKYDERVFLEWKKDANGSFYYLGEDGLMLRNQLIDDGTAKYWVGGDGAKVVNAWVQVPADDADIDNYDVEYRWFYFGATGKAVTGTSKTINEQKYFFDADGKMLFGYHDGSQIINEDDPFALEVVYYSGTNEDGAMKKNVWYKAETVTDFGAYEETDSAWVYFQSNGKKAVKNEYGYKWNGQRYYFDEFGKMLYGWAEIGSNSTAEAYLKGEDEGQMAKKQWVYTKQKYVSPADEYDSEKWFWLPNVGTLTTADKSCVKRINNKFYAFDDEYAMLSGVVELTNAGGIADPAIVDYTVVGDVEMDKITLAQWLAKEGSFFFFSDDYKNDGSLKKSVTFEVEFLDDVYKLTTDKTGELATGYNSSTKKYYINGYLLAADAEMRYEVKEVEAGTYKLLNASGAAVKAGSVVVDGDKSYYAVIEKDGAELICKADWALEYASRAAQAVKAGKETFAVGADTYKVAVGAAVEGVAPITYAK